MKTKSIVSVIAAFVTFLAPAHANTKDPYTLKARPGGVCVVPHGGWHINEDFPWSIKTSDGAYHSFYLSWNLADAKDLPQGEATGRGGVCSSTTCVTFGFKVKVP